MKYIAAVLFSLLLSAVAVASCTGSSPNWTSTPDYSSVSTCFTNASRGDTITVSSGSATWSSTLIITHGITLAGQGVGNTVITSGFSDVTPLIFVEPDSTAIANSENIKITGFTFDGNNAAQRLFAISGAGVSATVAYKSIIIGNNKFQNVVSGAGVIYTNGQVRGVIYGNTFDRCDIIIRPLGSDNTTESANTAYNNFSYGSADNLYFENNTIQYSSSYTSGDGNPGWVESGQGGRVVVRFNTWNMTNTSPSEYWDIHGFQNWNGTANSGQTGTMIVEYYSNTVLSGGGYRWIDHRGSWGIFFNNTFIGYTNPSIDVNQYYAGVPGGSGCTADINPTPTNYNPVVNNTYVFNNIVNGTLKGMTPGSIGNGCGIAENSNYWNEQTSFNGVVGVGYGLLSSRPATCTKGVGYWATDQGGWNNSGSGGQGVFYKCTSTNTWSLYYTPYTYPHPLASFSSAPLPPTNITVVVQ